MKNRDKIIHKIKIVVIIIVVSFLLVKISKLYDKIYGDTDYLKLGIKMNKYDIDYYTIYKEDSSGEYKVYKINNYHKEDSIYQLQKQVENSEVWNRDKYYEYRMHQFYEQSGRNFIDIDREDLYYYYGKGAYAIIDIKNAKLYYSTYLDLHHEEYSTILEIPTKKYEDREIYSVRGGPQNDGLDYYVYKFSDDNSEEIIKILNESKIWSKEKLKEDILDDFKYNEEVTHIENGYYHYKKICRTSDKYKKEHFTDEEATGWEIGVYDPNENILYYYWTSI